jgi:DNA-directed RNA polymerase specialized sigma24 family protein
MPQRSRRWRPDTPEHYRGIVSEDDGLAAFEALGGKLTWGEFARLLGHRDEQALSRAVLALPARQRQAVGLRKYTGLSELQAAAAMHISKGAVRSHLARGLQTLRHPPEP